MIIKMRMIIQDISACDILYTFENARDACVVATATDTLKNGVQLQYNNREYDFAAYPRIVQKVPVYVPYPLADSFKKTLGFYILENKNRIAKSYKDAVTCRKKGIFKKNIGFTAFEYQQSSYVLYRVGLPKEASHYYCLYASNGATVAIIERHNFYEDNCKATIYVEQDAHVTVALFACVKAIVSAFNATGETAVDLSAGPYISILQEERDLFDSAFLARVKNLG